MQIAFKRIYLNKLDAAIESLMSSRLYGAGNRLAMSQKTLDGIIATVGHSPLQYRDRYSNSKMIDVYNGIVVLKDNTLEFGEVLILAEVG